MKYGKKLKRYIYCKEYIMFLIVAWLWIGEEPVHIYEQYEYKEQCKSVIIALDKEFENITYKIKCGN